MSSRKYEKYSQIYQQIGLLYVTPQIILTVNHCIYSINKPSFQTHPQRQFFFIQGHHIVPYFKFCKISYYYFGIVKVTDIPAHLLLNLLFYSIFTFKKMCGLCIQCFVRYVQTLHRTKNNNFNSMFDVGGIKCIIQSDTPPHPIAEH